MKISDITEEFNKNQEKINKAKKKLQEAKKELNRVWQESSKKGIQMGNKFIHEVATKIADQLHLNERHTEGLKGGDNSLIQMYIVDRYESKVSIHNRKYMEKQHQPITFMIRDFEDDKEDHKEELPEDVTVEDAVNIIMDQVPKSFLK